MAGTREGGLKASKTNKSRNGADFYQRIGRLGGMLGNTGGFASNKVGKDGLTGRERSIIYGAIGGRKSKRGPVKKVKNDQYN